VPAITGQAENDGVSNQPHVNEKTERDEMNRYRLSSLPLVQRQVSDVDEFRDAVAH